MLLKVRSRYPVAFALGPSVALFFGLTVAGAASAQQVQVEMQVDRTELPLGQHFVLSIHVQLEDTEAESIELPNLDDFDVLRRHVSRPMQFSFSLGRAQRTVRSATQHTLVLQPRAVGRFEIPPVQVKVGGRTHRSKALTIVVQPGTGAGPVPGSAAPLTGQALTSPQGVDGSGKNPSEPRAAGADNGPARANEGVDLAEIDPRAFLRTVVDKREAYLGEQVTVTIYLYVRGRLRSAPTIETEPTADGFWSQDLLPPSRTLEPHRQMVQGRAYDAYVMRRFALFPLRTGELTLGPMTLSFDEGTIFDMLGGGMPSSLRRSSQPTTLQAKALPRKEQRPTGEVAVGRFQIEASLDREQVATGDAATLTARVQGEGNLRGVQLQLPKIPGMQVYPPQVRDALDSPGDVIGGTRTYQWLLVPETPGTHQLPALTFWSFDAQRERYVEVAGPKLTLVAAGRAVASTTAPPGSEPGERRSGDGDSDTAAVDADAPRFGPIHTQSALQRTSTPWVRSSWFWFALAAPPTLWLLALGLTRWAHRRQRVATRGTPRSRWKRAQQLLSDAIDTSATDTRKAYALTAQALHCALEIRLSEAVGGLTRAQLQQRLLEHGFDADFVTRLVAALDDSERARFSPEAPDVTTTSVYVAQAKVFLAQLERFRPQEAA